MNERERWIVYPLLFFALGASLRDKFLQHVSTKELACTKLVAQEILCEDLSVLDPDQDDRIVAKLTSARPTDGKGENPPRFGVLLLFDSEGRELCTVANNVLQVRQISCDEINAKTVSVVDPIDAQRRLALLTSATAKLPDNATRRVGSLLLTDDQGTAIFGLANDQMQMRNISCQGIAVVDPADESRVLAVLGSALVKQDDSDAEPRRLGVLKLNDYQPFIGLTGTATEATIDSPPPPGASGGAATTPADEPNDEEDQPADDAPTPRNPPLPPDAEPPTQRAGEV